MGILDRIAGRFDELVSGDGNTQARAQEDVALARDLAGRGDWEDAVVAFGRAADQDAANVDAWLGLAETLARLERFEPARDAFRRALTLPLSGEQRPRAQAALGRLYAQSGRNGKAIRELRKAVALLPDDAETLAAFGRVLAVAGEPEGSEWLARAARLKTDGGGVGLLLEAAAAKSEPGAAERLLREAAALAPENVAVRAALAHHLLGQGALNEALAEALAAATASPNDPAAWTALRAVHSATGDFAAALDDARHEEAHGRPPPFAAWLTLALGTEDRAAIEQALRHGQPPEPGFAEARAFLDGTLKDAGAAVLTALAPPGAARLFVARALAPRSPPIDNVLALLAWAESFAAGQRLLLPLAVAMARAAQAFDRPLLIAVMGEFNAGKSSFVNALAGDEIASVGVTPTTATINVLRYGPGGGRVIYHDGTAKDLRPEAIPSFLGALDDEQAAAIRQVEIFSPIEALRRVEIVDTPGLNSLRALHEKVARDFLVEADAIVWVFAAGQAAKATEREALSLAHAAKKHVLGVLNKVDRASAGEIAAIVRHVQNELGDLVEQVVPFSARDAVEAQRRADGAAVVASGLPAVEAALEAGFFGRARDLKRETATLALGRFVAGAQAAIDALPVPNEDHTGARAALAATEQRLRSALASERVALRARLDAAFRAAAFEVREFVRPRTWLFGEHTADPEDERFLCELLDDGALAASAKTRAVLLAALPDPPIPAGAGPVPPPPPLPVNDVSMAIDDAVERFRAYARGIVEGAAAVFFRVDLPGIRLDLAAIHNALARWSPDPEESLFRPVERAIDAFGARARRELDGRQQAGEIAGLMRREHLLLPLESLAQATRSLAENPRGGPTK